MTRVLVTGATGFVGANLARRLLADGHEVKLLVRRGSASWRIEEIRGHVELFESNLSDLSRLTDTLRRARPEWVFHLAVHGAYSTQTNVREMVNTNIVGTINLIEASLAAGVETIVNTGSSSEYGFKNTPPDETTVLEPNSHYAVTKASATLYCQFIARRQGLRMPTLRLYSVFGPYEEPTRLMPTLAIRGLVGRLPVLVAPEVAHDYVFVDDAVDAYVRAALAPTQEHGAIYNVGSGIQTSLRQVVEIVREQLAIEAEPDWGSMPNRTWDTSAWVADNRKIRERLGWTPRFSFAEGFAVFVAWLRAHPGLYELYRERLGNVS